MNFRNLLSLVGALFATAAGVSAQPIQITSQPTGITIAQGVPRPILVQATGGLPISYLWLRLDGGVFPAGTTGINSNAVVVGPATTAAVGVYYCILSNSVGSVTSAPAGLFMSQPGVPSAVATVVANPISQTAVAGTNVFLTAAGYGVGPLTLQWRGRTNPAVPFADIVGATNASLILSNVQQDASYVLRIDNGLAFPAATTVANLTVVRAPTVATNPVNLAAAIGSNVTFTGAINGGLIRYQWLKGGVPIGGETNSSLAFTVTNVSNAGGYALVGSNLAGSATSTVAQLTVVLPPVITTSPPSISVSAADSASFSAAASSATTMTFRWFINGNLMQTTTGAANSTFNVANLLSGGNLIAGLATNVPAPVLFSASNIAGVATAPATIVVTPLPIRPIITLQPLGIQVAQGQTRPIVVQATGGGTITYTWLRRDGGLLPAGSTGANAASLTVPTSSTAAVGVYYCVVANSAGSVTSAPAGLFMSLPGAPNSVATVVDNPQSQTAVAGSTVFLTAAGYGNGTLRLQWRGRTNSAVPFADMVGATNASLILSNVQESASYVLRIDNGLAFPAATTIANITVVRAPTVTTNPVSLAVAIGSTATFTGAIDGGLIGYAWLKDGNPIAGQTASVLSFAATNLSNAGGYSLVGSNLVGSVTSTVAQLIVVLPPAITGGPLNVSAPASGSAGFSATVGSATLVTNEWFINGNQMLTSFSPGGSAVSQLNLASLLSGGNLIAGLATNVPATVLFRASNLAGTSTASATLLVTAGPLPPVITLQPLGILVDQNQTRPFEVQATGSTPISYRWVRRDGGAIPVGSTGTNSNTFTVNTAATNAVATYYCVITNSVGSVTSAPAGVVMSLPGIGFSVPTIVESPLSQTVSPGATVFLTAAAYANGAIKLQWRGVTNTSSVPPGSQFFQDIPGATNATLVLGNLQDSARYALRIENPNGPVATAVATITVFRAPRVVSDPVGTVVAIGSSADFTGTIDGGFITYRWLKDGVLVPGPYSGALPASSLRVFANSVTNAGGYSLSGSNAFGSVTTAVAQLTVVLPPVISSGPVNLSVPATGSASFSAVASSITAMTYEWFVNGNLMQTTTGTGASQLNLASLLSGGNLIAGLATNVPATVLFRASNIAGSNSVSATLLVTPGPSAPVITLHPSSTNMLVGGTLGLAGTAAGNSPLAYQWRFNGTNLAGATNPALTIVSVAPAQAGPYSLFVSNPYGSVTSLVANVSVSSTTNREVRIAGITPSKGDPINVPVLLRGLGGESSVDFTLGYTGFLVHGITVNIPPGSPVTNVVRDAGAANAGVLGLHLDFDTNLTATAGERPLVTLTYDCTLPQLQSYLLNFAFLDAPRARLLSGGTNVLATDWVIAPFAPPEAAGNNVLGNLGLFRQSIQIFNPSSLPIASARVYAGGLGHDSLGNPIRLYNAVGTEGGVPYIEFGPIPAASSTSLTLEFYVSDRTTVPNPILTVVFGAGLPPVPANFTTPAIDPPRFVNGVFILEFLTTLNRTYYVQYKNDAGSTNWATSFPGVVGTGSRVQWIDNGPPRTSSLPTNGTRFYRVITPQ